MIDSFSHISILHLATLRYGKYNICWWRHWGRCLQSMTHAVQINLKQRIHSALNYEQMFFSSKWIYKNSVISHSNSESNFVEENVFLFFVVKAPIPVNSVTHCPTRQICQAIAMHSACSKHWIKCTVLLYTTLKANLNRWNFNIEIISVNYSIFVFKEYCNAPIMSLVGYPTLPNGRVWLISY